MRTEAMITFELRPRFELIDPGNAERGGRKIQNPKSKIQINSKSQTSKSNDCDLLFGAAFFRRSPLIRPTQRAIQSILRSQPARIDSSLDFGHWSLFGIWDLDFGAFLHHVH
jgi:hypothetical protein